MYLVAFMTLAIYSAAQVMAGWPEASLVWSAISAVASGGMLGSLNRMMGPEEPKEKYR